MMSEVADKAPSAVLSAEDAELLKAFRAAVAQDLSMFAVLHDAEPNAGLIHRLKTSRFPADLGLILGSPRAREAARILAAEIRRFPDPVDTQTLDELAVDYANIYLINTLRAAPCESVWFDDEGLACQSQMFQVRECYLEHGLAAANWRVRPDDHLVIQLQFIAFLFDPARSGDTLGELVKFMDEHLLRWLMRFAERVATRCDRPYFAGLAMLTAAYCDELRELLARILGEPRPSQKEIDARMRPKREVIPAVPLKYMPGLGPGW
jgi:TorA maturation chaperone TorD